MLRKILIVDDVALNRVILKNMLSQNYEISEAESGEAALELLSREGKQISAVLLDISMPGIDGYEVLRRMRDDVALSQIPVIMITANEDEASRLKALSEGANDFVMKPYLPDVIKHCLETNIALRESVVTILSMQRDKLTGLYNREPFFQRVRELVSEHPAGYYIMACFDVDSFKTINDQYGTQKGDEILRHIANVFRNGFVPVGGICCRVMADNFAVLYPASFRNTPEIEEIRRQAAHIDGLTVPIRFRIGRYAVDDLSLMPSTMYDRAYIAADSAKGRFDNRVAQYDESMRQQLLQGQEIVLEMESALQARQFEVWFQPQYNHSTSAMIGAEALVRWRHPVKGLIPPNKFIPIFERNGFIYSLDKFVWEEVCRYLRRWLDEGRNPLPVSVNISRYDVFCPDMISFITGLLERYRLPVDLLRLEVTESAFAEAEHYIIDVVKALISYGFTVEIDDFGSGYSSLNTLKDVPAQILKLDMKFLDSTQDSERGGNIVESVVRMAKWLDMAVIAEGVETKTQADYLRSIGCSYMQGYLFAKPMPASEYEEHCTGAEKEEHLLSLETVENLSNTSFWDPDSIDTLIFNSYVGAACIYEYHNGRIELLRATEKYAQVIGSAGMTVEDALKLDWTKHLNAETAKRVTEDLNKSIATNNEVTGEYIFHDLPGCPRETYLRSTMRVIASSGNRYLVYCTNENITAQRQAEKREREVAEEMRHIMANVDSGICAVTREADGNLRVLFANDRFYAMYGYTKQQMEAELPGVIAAVHPDDTARVRTTVEALFENKGRITYEYRCIKRDGSVITVSCNNAVASLPGISERVLLAVMYDVTGRIVAEQQMRKLSQQLQSIMDNVDVGIIASVPEGGSRQILFANEQYYAMRGYSKTQYAQEISNLCALIIPEERERVEEALVEIARTGKSRVLVYEIVRRDGVHRHFRNTVCIGSFEGVDEPVQLAISRDVTEEMAGELREKQANEQAQSIMRDIDSGISATVRKNGKIELLFSNEQFFRMRGYTKQEYEAEVPDYYTLIHPEDRARVKQAVTSAYSSKKPITEEYRILRKDKTERWIRANMTLTHFTGVAQPVLLSVYSDATAEKQAAQETLNAMLQLQNMMSDMPGGFVRMVVAADRSIRPVYFNEGFFKLTGMNYGELMQVYADDALAGVHPDDIHIVNEAVAAMFEKGEAYSSRYRLLHKNGNYIWLSIFGRITKDEDNTYLNIYYTDATEQIKEEERQKELLDNLPGGAGIYELTGNEMRLIYQNKSYWELVGLDEEAYPDPTPMSAIHPDDLPVIMQELKLAFNQKRDISCDIHLRHLKLGYRSVHLAGRIVPGANGGFLIYATFTPISSEGKSYQQMLPLLLSAIMDSTTDLSFAKDINFRYLSASRAFTKMVGFDSEQELVGKTDYDLFSKEIADKYRKDDISLLAGGEPLIDMVEPIPSVEGVPQYSSTSKYLLRDSLGEVVGIYGVGRDITRSLAQETRLHLVAQTIPGGLASYVCTPGAFSPEHIKLVYFNDGFCKLFGMTREEYESTAVVNPVDLIFKEDFPVLAEQWHCLFKLETPINCLYRIHVKDGGYKWISHKAVAADRSGDTVIVNAILQDVTDQRELIERLRISEEENALAVGLGENTIARFSIAERTLSISAEAGEAYSLPTVVRNVPDEPIALGLVAPESADVYRGFFDSITRGSKTTAATYKQKYLGAWHWIEAKSATIFSDSGKPFKAVISFCDVTEQLEKETIYRKWQQAMEERQPDTYALFRCNLNDSSSFATAEGTLLTFDFDNAGVSFNERASVYIRQCIFEEDREAYAALVNSDVLLANYYRAHRTDTLEYRELLPQGGVRWLRLSIDLVEHPNSSHIEAYLLYENIDEAKTVELQTKVLSETDSLTGLLNRTTFISRVEELLHSAKPGSLHAMLMLDVDGFKRINDVFGHGVGDRVLLELSGKLRAITRSSDLLARLGGDEFLLFLTDLPDENTAAIIAKQICTAVRKSFSVEVKISGSIGIALAPKDGEDFNTLYKKADSALYFVKGSGKNDFTYYTDAMEDEHLQSESDSGTRAEQLAKQKRRRILIVDDDTIEHTVLQNIFRDEFIIEKAKDGNTALIRLQHYGSAISAVLLDLFMPGMDGFTVLEQMQSSTILRTIPVIIVSGDNSRDTCLRAIRSGAVDYVTKPVDPEILRIRLHSAVSKAENERLRTTNSLLQVQYEERLRFEAAVDSVGIAFIEYDWLKGTFLYHPSVTKCLLGAYDNRGLWQILLSDMVADTQTVRRMQKLVHRVADERAKRSGSLNVMLMTHGEKKHCFRMTVRKLVDPYDLTRKLIITLIDLDDCEPSA